VARRNMLGEQMQQLQHLQQAGRTGKQQAAELDDIVASLQGQLQMLEHSLEVLKRPAPQASVERIVTLEH
jgi:hypothetical protein